MIGDPVSAAATLTFIIIISSPRSSQYTAVAWKCLYPRLDPLLVNSSSRRSGGSLLASLNLLSLLQCLFVPPSTNRDSRKREMDKRNILFSAQCQNRSRGSCLFSISYYILYYSVRHYRQCHNRAETDHAATKYTTKKIMKPIAVSIRWRL